MTRINKVIQERLYELESKKFNVISEYKQRGVGEKATIIYYKNGF